DLEAEQVRVTLNPHESQVEGDFYFYQTGDVFKPGVSRRLREIRLDFNQPLGDLMDQVQTYRPMFYFPVYVPDDWKMSANTFRDMDFQAQLLTETWTDHLLIAFIPPEKIDDIPRFQLPAIEGAKAVWCRAILVRPAAVLPNRFRVRISYRQPYYFVNAAARFAYMPLLPAGEQAHSNRYRISVDFSLVGWAIVSSKHSAPPGRINSSYHFRPDHDEPIVVEIGATRRKP
ncbi:MAG: hypothetical protein U1E27_04235, partial [Kiritimatiellia bacterium]|nr:hypothetical protein [Kiritimatiellia bacterium]